MSESRNVAVIPKLEDLVKETSYEQNALMVILNQHPPDKWLKNHPTATRKVIIDGREQKVPIAYMPRERVEYLLTRIYGRWWVEIKDVKLIANSVVTTVRLFVTNPLTKEVEWQDGVGAQPIQTDSGAGAVEFDKMKNNAIQLAAPASETYAIKDAAEKFGKVFGKDLNVTEIDYNSLLKTQTDVEDLRALYEMKKDALTPEQDADALRIMNNEETNSYKKLFNHLKSL